MNCLDHDLGQRFHDLICRYCCDLIVALLYLAYALPLNAADAQQPNVILILTDNHGAWTLGCYGNKDIRTPHIDQLAKAGTLMTRAFASNPVCSPTRATMLTGLVPSQHGVHCFLRGGNLQVGPAARNTLDEFESLPEVLHKQGYSCGLVGKWHLGGNMSPQEQLNDYWITMPHGGTSTFYDAQIIEAGKQRTEPKYLTEFWTDHAVKFIEQSTKKEKPFFLYLAYNGPYALSRLLLTEGKNRHAEYYADKELPSFPREKTHPWQFSNRDYANNPVSIRRVATEVSGVDDGVGRVMATLKERGINDNTIIVFAGDQGWVGGQGGFFGMGDHTRPLTARDGMMQIPMIWWHPGKIAADKRAEQIVTNYDFMPTLLSHMGLKSKVPKKPVSPGRDFSAILSGKQATDWDNTAFYEFENLRCVRTERWKYVHRHPNGPHELYDLQNDPDEFNNLVTDADHDSARKQLKQQLDQFYNRYAQPKYDMWQGGGSQTFIFDGIDEELAQLPKAEPPALPKDFPHPELKVPEGYQVELVAGPPLVQHPTMACFDDRGRLFVSENAGVNMSDTELEETLPNSIRMLEDTDDDGQFDRSTIFADHMTFPMGGAWHDGALYVAAPPNIWRLEDTDRDGVADQRTILVDKFGYNGNAASVHGCFNGPDGRIYWCDGRHGHEFRDEAGNVVSKRAGSYIFSCKPDGSDVQIHCGGGMDNPVEVDFTNEGEMIGTVNIMYSRPRIDCQVHWLYGGAYPHSERVLGELKRTGDLLGPIHNFGHVAVSGTVRYRSGVLDHNFRDNFFTTLFNSGKVVRLELTRSGSTFKTTQREFLSSPSRDFHPTDVLEDADGSLLVVDTGGWFYRGCPTSQLAKPDILGGIYRITRKGMTPMVDPWGKRIDWANLPHNKLASTLNETRYKVRERAIQECVRRGARMIPQLTGSITSRDIRERRNAVWALTRMVTYSQDAAVKQQAQAAIQLALQDARATIRLTACRSIATNPDAAAATKLLELVKTDQPAIRREAAKALGRIGDLQAVPVLLGALSKQIDRAEEHAIIYALIEINQSADVQQGLKSASPSINKGTLIALDQMENGNLQADQVAQFLQVADPALQTAAIEIFRNHDDWADTAVIQIGQLLEDPNRVAEQQNLLLKLLQIYLKEPAAGAVVAMKLNDPQTPQVVRQLLLKSIADANALPLHDGLEQPIAQLLKSNKAEEIALGIAAAASFRTNRFNSLLQQIGANTKQTALLRLQALEAVSGGSSRFNDAGFELLLSLLSVAGSPAETLRAAQMIAGASLTKSQLLQLSAVLPTAGPMMLRDLIKPYLRNRDPEVIQSFLDAMAGAKSFLSLPPHEYSNIIKRYPDRYRDQANQLLDQLKQHDQQKLARLDQLLPLLAKGDPIHGRTIFFAEKSKCAVCHRIGQKGGKIGPDLTTIGRNRSARDLLESIVYPSASLVRQYEPFTLLTSEGKVLSGLIARETADTIYIQQTVGEPVAVLRSDIEEISPGTVSIMPNGLDKTLTEKELADVIAYLLSLKRAQQNATSAD